MKQLLEQNVPALRFPEFQSHWDTLPFSQISTYQKGYAFKSDDYIESGIRVVRVSDLTESKLKSFNDNIYINKSLENEYKRYKILKNEIIITTVGSKPNLLESAVGRAIYVDTNDWGLLNQNLLKVRAEENYSNGFIYNFLQRKAYTNFIWEIQRGNANQSNIAVKDLFSLKITIPNIEEQQKIAAFLGAVDDKIAQLQKKKDLLESYKKGCMQKLFSQEIRFKDDNGNPFPDWTEKKIEDIYNITRGYVLAVPKMTQIPKDGSVFPVYSSQTKNNGLTGYYTEYLYEDAMTWTTDGANAGDVKYRKGRFYCTNVCGVLISNSGNANLCMSEMLNAITHKYVSYVGNPKLMNNVMAKIKLPCPHPEEQKKIADFLSALDNKIAAVADELAKAKDFKKGLLQQMFV